MDDRKNSTELKSRVSYKHDSNIMHVDDLFWRS